MPTAAIIPAAGSGIRFGETKQFKLLGKTPLFIHTLTPFLQSKKIEEIILVVPQDNVNNIKNTLSSLDKNIIVISGGPHRQDSVYRGLKKVSQSCNKVCIHDGARPFVSIELIESTIKGCVNFDGVIVAENVTDTVKLVTHGRRVQKTLDRNKIWLAQTPQTFNKKELVNAFLSSRRKNIIGTDEAMIMEEMGYSIGIVEGSNQNIKITTKEDWRYAESIMSVPPSQKNPQKRPTTE
ncbi:MAG TPA: 2-C-methyl-D-erythritol 4-phosphate cytidylyltransferase [Candidatus Marinimicrobia bacterium]|jgi:2-C-methyl-D-erythritol 4-phosphate cytidylyltransferase|nr:2-C-methyl-D-erythritol 4-phosphate cytidylyltransferase [Candidatus Neomarinimicrobiota bacterium]|tara:strand:+ start:5817 stop:6527 length:711 start_codon:yes stop_codon:yes gene_type:complete